MIRALLEYYEHLLSSGLVKEQFGWAETAVPLILDLDRDGKVISLKSAVYMATVYGYEDIDTFLAENGYDGMDDYLSAAKETVEGNVTRTLILQAVAEKEGIEAQESDFQAYFGSGRTVAAENYGKGYTAQLALEYSVGRLLQENVVLN